MNLSLFIARRYLVSKKSHNAINIISGVALGGIGIITAALIIVLSVFNGISGLVKSLYNSIDSDIEITALRGKTFIPAGPKFDSIRHLNGVRYFNETMQDKALLKYGDRQCLAYIKGVGKEFVPMTQFDTLVRVGKYFLKDGDLDYGVFGGGVADKLGINPSGSNYYSISSYAFKRGFKTNALNPEDAITHLYLYMAGTFSINDDFDSRYVIVSIDFARQLFDYKDSSVTSIEIGLKNSVKSSGSSDGKSAASFMGRQSSEDDVKQKIKSILGNDFVVKDRFEQNELLFKTLKSEKLWTFIILVFILIIATFNIVGSLTMLIIDKQKDIEILHNMGAEIKSIQKIFMYEGILITVIGALGGLLLGTIVCLVQIYFKVVPMSEGFVISAYPVTIQATDYIWVLTSVLIIGFLASWYPVRAFASTSAKKQ